MGSFLGFMLIHHRGELTKEAAKAKLRAALELEKEAGCFGTGLWAREAEARAYWAQERQWLLVNDSSICQGLDEQCALAAAKRYAWAFGAPALSMSVVDSDFSVWAYADPAKGEEAIRVAGRPDGYMDVEDDGLLEPPWFLLPALPGQTRESLELLWREEHVFEDDRLYALAKLLGVELIHFDYEEIPEGVEPIRLK